MSTIKKTRKSPLTSATKFSIGTKKKGNDGNMWKVVKTKGGIKRWAKILNNDDNIWGKNKKLENFWKKLSSGSELVLIYTNDKIVHYKMPKTYLARSNKYKEFLKNSDIKAIITSSRSSDSYLFLYKKVKNKTPNEIIKNYKKYLTNYGKGDKTWYL
jgi:DNA-directed RNA polymerase alpha subunit